MHLDDELWFGAQVHCIISTPVTHQSSVSNIIYAWQWDKSWPNPLALTRQTADLFPQLDPKCILTDSTRSRLYSGKLGLTKYFSDKGVQSGNGNRVESEGVKSPAKP